MPAPLTPNMTAAKQAEIVTRLNTFFTASQVEALLRVLDDLSVSDAIEDLDARVTALEAV